MTYLHGHFLSPLISHFFRLIGGHTLFFDNLATLDYISFLFVIACCKAIASFGDLMLLVFFFIAGSSIEMVVHFNSTLKDHINLVKLSTGWLLTYHRIRFNLAVTFSLDELSTGWLLTCSILGWLLYQSISISHWMYIVGFPFWLLLRFFHTTARALLF